MSPCTYYSTLPCTRVVLVKVIQTNCRQWDNFVFASISWWHLQSSFVSFSVTLFNFDNFELWLQLDVHPFSVSPLRKPTKCALCKHYFSIVWLLSYTISFALEYSFLFLSRLYLAYIKLNLGMWFWIYFCVHAWVKWQQHGSKYYLCYFWLHFSSTVACFWEPFVVLISMLTNKNYKLLHPLSASYIAYYAINNIKLVIVTLWCNIRVELLL